MPSSTLELSADSLDELLSLGRELSSDSDLRGSVKRMDGGAQQGTLGGAAETILLTLSNGAAIGAIAPIIISWIRNRHSDVSIRLKRVDGSEIEIHAERVQRASAEQLTEIAERINKLASGAE